MRAASKQAGYAVHNGAVLCSLSDARRASLFIQVDEVIRVVGNWTSVTCVTDMPPGAAARDQSTGTHFFRRILFG